MLRCLAVFSFCAVMMSPFAFADHRAGSSGHASPCCLSVEGQTAHVLLAPSADAVRRVQAELAVRGFNPGPVDGVMGPRTEQALRTFQRDQGIVEGLLTVETLSRLGISVRQHSGAHGQMLSGGTRHRTQRTHHTNSCCHTTTRRVVRRHVSRAPTSTVRPAPKAQAQPAAQRLPNYVSAFTNHEVEALEWSGKTPR